MANTRNTSCGKMSQGHSPPEAARTSAASSKKSAKLRMSPLPCQIQARTDYFGNLAFLVFVIRNEQQISYVELMKEVEMSFMGVISLYQI